MAKGDVVKFVEGGVAGLALGIAAGIFLSSKKGKALQRDVKDKLADFYQYVAPKIKKAGNMGEKEYKEFMENAAREYGKAKKFSEDTIKQLIVEIKKSWGHFSELLAGK